MTGRLETLPPEIVDGIAQNLELSDHISLRLTCRTLVEKSFHHFEHTYFTKITTNMSLHSIQKLEAVSLSPWASKHVKLLRLDWNEEAGCGIAWERDDSDSVLADLPVVRQVRDIMLRFPSYQSLHVRAPHEHEYTQSASTEILGCSDMLGFGFLLIAETTLPLKTLNIEFWGAGGSIRVKTNQLHSEQILRLPFKKALANLEELSLRVDIAEGPRHWIWDIVSAAPRLQKLTWNVHLREEFFFEPIGLSDQIRELTLRIMSISEENLIRLLRRCQRRLESLTIVRTTLTTGNWKSLFRSLHQGDLPNLKSVSFHNLKSGWSPGLCTFIGLDGNVEVPGSHGQKLKLGRESPGRMGVAGVDYSGPGIRNVIEKLVHTVEQR